jgi:hypothetical protein
MKPDIYTKAVLTVIAFALTLIALKPLFSPPLRPMPSRRFPGFQFSGPNNGYEFFDARTGEVWVYYDDGRVHKALSVARLGQPASK